MSTVVNIAVLRTLVSELASGDKPDEYGHIELTQVGISLGLRWGHNGHALDERKVIPWADVGGLTINGAKHMVHLLRQDLYSSADDEDEED